MTECGNLTLRTSFLGKKSDPERLKKYPEKVRYKVIGVEMKGVKSSMKLVVLGATQRKGYSLLAKKVNLAMLIPAWFYVRNAI